MTDILDFICNCHWPAPYNTYGNPFQMARFRGLVENVFKSTTNVLQTNQTLYQGGGGVRTFMNECYGSVLNWHFAASAMKVRFVDPAESALQGDRNLTHIRLRESENFIGVFDMSLLSFAISETQANIGREVRRDLTYRLEGAVPEDIQQTLAICPMRVMARDSPPEVNTLFVELSKWCTFAHNDMTAQMSRATFETIKEYIYPKIIAFRLRRCLRTKIL